MRCFAGPLAALYLAPGLRMGTDRGLLSVRAESPIGRPGLPQDSPTLAFPFTRHHTTQRCWSERPS